MFVSHYQAQSGLNYIVCMRLNSFMLLLDSMTSISGEYHEKVMCISQDYPKSLDF